MHPRETTAASSLLIGLAVQFLLITHCYYCSGQGPLAVCCLWPEGFAPGSWRPLSQYCSVVIPAQILVVNRIYLL